MASADNKSKTGFDAPAVVLCGLAAIILAYAFSLFMGGGFNALLIREKEAKIYTADISDAVKAQIAEQQTLLDEGVRYLDPEKGVLRMPIEDAMDRVVTLNAR